MKRQKRKWVTITSWTTSTFWKILEEPDFKMMRVSRKNLDGTLYFSNGVFRENHAVSYCAAVWGLE